MKYVYTKTNNPELSQAILSQATLNYSTGLVEISFVPVVVNGCSYFRYHEDDFKYLMRAGDGSFWGKQFKTCYFLSKNNKGELNWCVNYRNGINDDEIVISQEDMTKEFIAMELLS